MVSSASILIPNTNIAKTKDLGSFNLVIPFLCITATPSCSTCGIQRLEQLASSAAFPLSWSLHSSFLYYLFSLPSEGFWWLLASILHLDLLKLRSHPCYNSCSRDQLPFLSWFPSSLPLISPAAENKSYFEKKNYSPKPYNSV